MKDRHCPRCDAVAKHGIFGVSDAMPQFVAPTDGARWRVRYRNCEYGVCYVVGKRLSEMYYLDWCDACNIVFPGWVVARNEEAI